MEVAQSKRQLKHLEWRDLIIITIIMFGWAMLKSLAITFGIIQSNDTGAADAEFNYWPNLILQTCLLLVAIGYLVYRGFDFKRLNFKVKWYVVLLAPLLFFLLGLLVDIGKSIFTPYNFFTEYSLTHLDFSFSGFLNTIGTFTPLLVVYSLLNGFYEEFFFLGILANVRKEYRAGALLLSTIVRILIHTYQGWTSAFITGIGVGLLFYVLYRFVLKNVLPFTLAHALWDMYGGSLMYYLVIWS